MPHSCPVCHYPELKEAPHSTKNGASFEICPSCGFQFGVDDDDRGITHERWRQQWIEAGMKWSSRGTAKPDNWNPELQLKARRPRRA